MEPILRSAGTHTKNTWVITALSTSFDHIKLHVSHRQILMSKETWIIYIKKKKKVKTFGMGEG